MQAIQLKLQKGIMIGSLVLSAVLVAYALGFSTQLYALSYHADKTSSLFYVEGAELYRNAQPFNRLFFSHTVLYFIVCLTMFITLTHRRRLYYVSNYITSLVYAGYSVFLGVNLWSYAVYFKQLYLQIDFNRLKEVTDMMRMKYVQSTFMLDAGMVLSMVMYAMAAVLCVNLLLKTLWMRREKWEAAP